jgi:DNA-binding NarL/FixJ family response regulator
MRLAICDEQWLFAAVLNHALTQHGHEVVATTDDPEILLAAAARLSPDICLLDLVTGPHSVVEVAERLRELDSAPVVVVLTDAGQDPIWQAYDAGLLTGLVNKACAFSVLASTLDRVAVGEHVAEGWPASERHQEDRAVVDAITTRELEVLRLVVQGHSTQTMADRLGVSRHTVRTHVQQVLRKLGVHGRGKVARAAAEAGLIDVAALTGPQHPAQHHVLYPGSRR